MTLVKLRERRRYWAPGTWRRIQEEVRVTSSRSSDRALGPPDRIRPRLVHPLPSRQPPLPKRPPLLPPTRCLFASLSPSERSARPVSAPSDWRLYHRVPRFAHGRVSHAVGGRSTHTAAPFHALPGWDTDITLNHCCACRSFPRSRSLTLSAHAPLYRPHRLHGLDAYARAPALLASLAQARVTSSAHHTFSLHLRYAAFIVAYCPQIPCPCGL
jgi:hypothetical protein